MEHFIIFLDNIIRLEHDLVFNIEHAMHIVPHVPLVSELWDIVTQQDALLFIEDTVNQVTQVGQFLDDPTKLSPAHLGEIEPILDEFKIANGLNHWNNLTVQEQSKEFININVRNLSNLKSTTSNPNRVVSALIDFHIRNNTLDLPANQFVRNLIINGPFRR